MPSKTCKHQLWKIMIAISRQPFAMQAKYLRAAPFLQAGFIQRFAHYPANFFDATGGRKNTQGEENGLNFNGF